MYEIYNHEFINMEWCRAIYQCIIFDLGFLREIPLSANGRNLHENNISEGKFQQLDCSFYESMRANYKYNLSTLFNKNWISSLDQPQPRFIRHGRWNLHSLRNRVNHVLLDWDISEHIYDTLQCLLVLTVFLLVQKNV